MLIFGKFSATNGKLHSMGHAKCQISDADKESFHGTLVIRFQVNQA